MSLVRDFDQLFLNSLIAYANSEFGCNHITPPYSLQCLNIMDKAKISNSYPNDGTILLKLCDRKSDVISYRKWFFEGGSSRTWSGVEITEDQYDNFNGIL